MEQQEQTNKFLLPAAIIVAGALVAGAVYFGGSTSGRSLTDRNEKFQETNVEIAPVSASDHLLGNRDAEIIIIEYSDIECPFCKVFHGTMNQIVRDYDGDVAWVYRHFPIAQLHANAMREAEATECAAELGGEEMFWRYINTLFERTNSNDSLPLSELPKIAAELGLNEASFNSCLASGKHVAKIQASIEEAVKAGARGTPYSVIIKGDKKLVINGAENLATVKAMIDSL